MAKRIKIAGYLEVPDGLKLELGQEVDLAYATGEITGDDDKLTHKDSGETTVTTTFTLTLDPEETKVGKISPRTGPLDTELEMVGRDDSE